MSNYPLWSTPNRRNRLVELFLKSNGFCVFGHKKCLIPNHHYELFIEGIISDWKADDRIERSLQWQAERKALHSLAERRFPLKGEFNNIGKDIFFNRQPVFYLEGLGISGLTFKPIAKVRLSSSYIHLFVDISQALKGVRKAKKRKAIRYGKPLASEVNEQINNLCNLAVRDYLK